MARVRDDAGPGRLAGVVEALVFLVFVAGGAAFIVWSKLTGLRPLAVTGVPIALMVVYALAQLTIRSVRLRDDQTGDNLYYMGFLFTLTSLASSLWQFEANGAAEDIVRNFGIAIASTVAGIALRIFVNQLMRDPVTVERVARTDLADAARRVKRELDAAVIEMNQFRRATEQAALESWTGVRDQVQVSSEAIVDEVRRAAAAGEPAASSLPLLVESLAQTLTMHGESLNGLTAALAEAEAARAEERTAVAALAAKLDAVLDRIDGRAVPISAERPPAGEVLS